jgi:hypothetical protein
MKVQMRRRRRNEPRTRREEQYETYVSRDIPVWAACLLVLDDPDP